MQLNTLSFERPKKHEVHEQFQSLLEIWEKSWNISNGLLWLLETTDMENVGVHLTDGHANEQNWYNFNLSLMNKHFYTSSESQIQKPWNFAWKTQSIHDWNTEADVLRWSTFWTYTTTTTWLTAIVVQWLSGNHWFTPQSNEWVTEAKSFSSKKM